MQNLKLNDEVLINSGLYQGQFAVVVNLNFMGKEVVAVRLRSGTTVNCNATDLRLFSLPNSKIPPSIETAIAKQIESDTPKRKHNGKRKS